MGCSNFKEDNNISPKIINYSKKISKNLEEYSQLDSQSFDLYYYQLLWKIRPTICFFQLRDKEKIGKSDVFNYTSLMKQKILVEQSNINYLIKEKMIIVYIHSVNGVVITRNKNKVNYFLMNNMNNIIDICLVDISNVNLNGGEKFSIYELKTQSKYYFNMENKEIDFSKRNELISLGKQEHIFEKESSFEDEELDEKNEILQDSELVLKFDMDNFIKKDPNEEKESFFQNDNNNNNNNSDKDKKTIKRKSIQGKNLDIDKTILNDIETYKPKKPMKKRLSKIINFKEKNTKNSKIKLNEKSLKKIKKGNNMNKSNNRARNNNKNTNTSSKEGTSNIKNIQININISNNNNNINVLSNFNVKNKKVKNQDTIESNRPYEIIEKCLILNTLNFTKELNKELEKLFFESNLDERDTENYTPFDHIIFSNFKEEGKKSKSNSKIFDNINTIANNLEKFKEKENINTNHINSNFIIIHNRYKKPFEQRKCKNDINKIYFKGNDLKINNESVYYLKEFVEMVICYKNLIQIKFDKGMNDSLSYKNLIFWKYLKKLFQENFNIRWISLKQSDLDDNIMEIFLSSLLMKRIRYLNISNNQITNKSMYFLNKFLIKNQTLSYLYMNNNPNITIEGIRLITTALQMHPNISKLDISNINLEGSGQFISQLLYENKCLKELNLRNINLNKNDITFLAAKLSENNKLIFLDLGLNYKIGDEGMKEIGKIIYNNKSLKSIGLDGLYLTMNNYLPIFEAITKNKNIESYSLNMNSGLPLKGILNFFLKNPQVKEISITPWDIEKESEFNRFTEDQLYAIEKFHLKAPNVNIKGIRFIEADEIG